MSPSPRSEALFFDGRVGRLEGVLELPADAEARAAAVVCHPHPLHGGTLQNKVAHTLSRAFVAQEFAVLRFNFRGVGKSAGEFDNGVGERLDVLCAVDLMRSRFPDIPLWLGGFSFGAAMAVSVAGETQAAGLVSVAPAASRLTGDELVQPACPWLIVHGANDELVAIGDTIEWVNSMAPGPELCVFPETSHFFHGKLIKLRELVAAFVGKHTGKP